MKRLISLTAIAALTFVAGVILSGCESDESPKDASPARSAPRGDVAPAAADSAPGRIVPLDPTTGSLGATAVGKVKGAWTFDDVNGARLETVRGGTTLNALQLEAHQVPPDVHLRLHLASDGDLTSGRYAIGAPGGRMLDAHFEYQGHTFRAIGQARGSVELTSITADRAVGTYDVTLESLRAAKGLVTLSGSFDIRVQ